MERPNQLHYGWIMVIIMLFILSMFALSVHTFGVYLKPLSDAFGWDRADISLAFSLFLIFSAVLGIPAGRLSDRYGPRALITVSGILMGSGYILMSQVTALWQVYLIYSLFIGVGGACCVVPLLSTIPRWFAKRKGLASGLTITGLGVGGAIGSPIVQWLITNYSLQYTYIVMGSTMVVIMVSLAQFLKHSPQSMGMRPYGDEQTEGAAMAPGSGANDIPFRVAVRSAPFWLYGTAWALFLFILQMLLTHTVPSAVDIGIPAMVAATLMSVVNVGSIVGRNLAGIFCDRVGTRLTLLTCMIIFTTSLIWLLFAGEAWMLFIFAIVFSIAFGGATSIQVLVLAELFGEGQLGILYGILQLIGTIGGSTGSPVGGAIFDATGNYNIAFIICVVAGIISVILSFALLKTKIPGKGETS